MVKVVGKPYEGKPHVRFEAAGGGNQIGNLVRSRRHPLTLQADGCPAEDPEVTQRNLGTDIIKILTHGIPFEGEGVTLI